MPATHYIVSVQVALLAASAAYLRTDSAGSGDRKKGIHSSEVEMAMAEYCEDAAALAAARAGSFALADQVKAAPDVAARTMGFRGGMPVTGRSHQAPAEKSPAVQATVRLTKEDTISLDLPGEGIHPKRKMQTPPAGHVLPAVPGVPLSGVGPEEVKFDPVPDGEGYSITADSATNFDLQTKTVVFAGNVSLHCEEFTLTSDRLVVHMEQEGGSMNQMVANGDVDVRLTQGAAAERFHGFGEEATYDPKGQRIVFRGWPRILGQGREHRAASASTKMTLHTNPAKLVTEGRAQTRILPGQGGSLGGLVGQ